MAAAFCVNTCGYFDKTIFSSKLLLHFSSFQCHDILQLTLICLPWHFLIYRSGSISFSLELYLNCVAQAANAREFMFKPPVNAISNLQHDKLSHSAVFFQRLRCECKWLYLVAVLKLQSDKMREKIGIHFTLLRRYTKNGNGVVWLCGKMWNIEATALWWMKLYANYVSFIKKKRHEKQKTEVNDTTEFFFSRLREKRENMKLPVKLYSVQRARERENKKICKKFWKSFLLLGFLRYWNLFRALLHDDIKILNLISSRLRYGFGW